MTYEELNEEIHDRLLLLRTEPQKFARSIKRRLINYKSNNLYHRPGYVPIRTIEGKKAAERLVNELTDMQPLPIIGICDGLNYAAQELAHMSNYNNIEEVGRRVITEYGNWFGNLFILIDEGSFSGLDVLQALLLDDGLKEKTNKAALLNPLVSLAGVGSAPNKKLGTIVVVLLATDFREKNNIVEPDFPQGLIPRYPELDDWNENAIKLNCEIIHQKIADKNITKIKKYWEMPDSTIVTTEKIID